jgi:hypothetical protein
MQKSRETLLVNPRPWHPRRASHILSVYARIMAAGACASAQIIPVENGDSITSLAIVTAMVTHVSLLVWPPWWDRAHTRTRTRHGHASDGRAARTPHQSMCTTSEALVG